MRKDANRHEPAETPDVSDIANVDVSHETSDVNVGTLFKFIIYTFVSTVVILVAMKLMMNYFLAREIAQELPPASRVNPPGTRRLPPMPRLQGAPGSDLLPLDEMKRFKKEQQAAINSYGWVDRNTGVVRIPIEEAKRLVLERGLPMRSPSPSPAASPAVAPAPSPQNKRAEPAKQGTPRKASAAAG